MGNLWIRCIVDWSIPDAKVKSTPKLPVLNDALTLTSTLLFGPNDAWLAASKASASNIHPTLKYPTWRSEQRDAESSWRPCAVFGAGSA